MFESIFALRTDPSMNARLEFCHWPCVCVIEAAPKLPFHNWSHAKARSIYGICITASASPEDFNKARAAASRRCAASAPPEPPATPAREWPHRLRTEDGRVAGRNSRCAHAVSIAYQ